MPALQIQEYQSCKAISCKAICYEAILVSGVNPGMSEHLLEMAKALVRVKDGKVEVLTEPGVQCCPLRQDLYGITKESRETVQRILEGHMQKLGMYGPERVLDLQEKPVSFGASEILSDAMSEGLVDAAVLGLRGRGNGCGDEAGGPAGHWSPHDRPHKD